MKRGSGKITWGHLGKIKTYKHALQTERPNLSAEDRKRIISQKMTPYDSTNLNVKVVFAGAAYLSGDTTPTPTPSPTPTPAVLNCDWSGITAQFGYNTNDWNECQPVPVVSPSVTPTNTITPSVTRTPSVTPTHTPTPSPSQPGTSGVIDYFDAAFYDGDGDWESLTTDKRFKLINSPTKITDFSGMISFDGVDDYGISNANIIPNTSAWSIEFWYRFNSASCSYGANRMLTDGRTGISNTNNFSDDRECNGNARWQFDGIPDAPGVNYGVSVPAQVVYTYSGGTVEVFLNGVNQYSNSGYTYTWSANRLTLLTTNDVNKTAADFGIIRTYGYKLTSTDVLNNFNQFKSRFGL